LCFESAVAIADEDGDAVIELRSVRVYEIQLSVSVEVARAHAGGIAAGVINDTRQEGSIAPVKAHADAVAGAEDRAGKVGPAVSIEVAHLHVGGDVVPPILDLHSILKKAVRLAVENEGSIPI
jgi:hypothetical protein